MLRKADQLLIFFLEISCIIYIIRINNKIMIFNLEISNSIQAHHEM